MLLALVLLVSAAAKLRDPEDTVAVFGRLELPRLLLTLRAPRLLPYGELGVAALLVLLPGPGYVVATSLALVLFGCYLVVVLRALRFDHPVRCGCFGRLGLGWVTRQTAVRNTVLVLVALVAWVDSFRGDGVPTRLAGFDEEDWWWLAAVLLAMATTGVVVRIGRLPPEPEPPEQEPASRAADDDYVALPVPDAVVDGPDGSRSLWALTDTAARLLVFWDPRDAGAAAIVARLPLWQRELPPVRVHLVSRSAFAEARALWPDVADSLLGDPDGSARVALRVLPYPGAVLLGTDRLLAGGPVAGMVGVEGLVEAAAEQLRGATSEA